MKTGKNQVNLEELGLGLTGIEGEEGIPGREDNEMMVLQVTVTGLSLFPFCLFPFQCSVVDILNTLPTCSKIFAKKH